MSPSWFKFRSNRRATLVLSPAGVALSGPGLAPAFHAAASSAWPAALELAQAMLPEKPAFTSLEVILAGVWGRCLLSPPLASLPKAEDLDALARQTAAEAYGPQALEWVAEVQVQGRDLPLIVSVIEPAWLESLRQLAASRRLKLHGVTPLLAACWNDVRRKIPTRADWFALAEPGRLQLLALDNGRWTGLSSTRCEVEGIGLRTLLHRETQFLGRSGKQGEAWIYATQFAPPPSKHWRWNLLTPLPSLPFGNLLGAA